MKSASKKNQSLNALSTKKNISASQQSHGSRMLELLLTKCSEMEMERGSLFLVYKLASGAIA